MDKSKAIREVAKGFAGLVHRIDNDYLTRTHDNEDKKISTESTINQELEHDTNGKTQNVIQKNNKNY